ncbi:MAG: dockerin type I repeat-containing protein [Muribaculaceae bacterium]|nr:dockerin type I repeat-containing protein [Muribaculaceae bacterium]
MKKYIIPALCLLMTLVTLTATAQQRAPYKTKVICGVVKADSWLSNNTREGIYELVLDDGSLTKLTQDKDVYQAPLGGAVYEDGKMKGVHFRTVWDDFDQTSSYILYHVEYDMETWTRTRAVTLGDMDRNYISSCGLAKTPLTGENYGIFYNFNMSWQVLNRKLATIDFTTDVPTRQIIGTLSTPMAAIAFADNGLLYGVGQDGYLYVIDTDATTESEVEVLPLGDLGIDNISTNPSSMTYNSRTGNFLWSVVLNNGKCCLYEVDPTLGAVSASLLMQSPDNAWLVNLYIPDPEAAEDAPAAVTNLAADFVGAATMGTITFTAPTTTYTGDPLTGTLAYMVEANGTEVATGSVEPGATATAQVTVEPGDVTFIVTVSNQDGVSPVAKLTTFVGSDRPLAPTDVVFDYNPSEKLAVLSWLAPTAGEHGAELNDDDLAYNIYLMPADTLAAAQLAGNRVELSFDPETLAAYYFKVEPLNAGVAGEPAVSNRAVVGPALNVPYTQRFATDASFDLLTVLDRNEDGISWQWDKNYGSSGGGRAYCGSNSDLEALANDDWLLSPPISLERGATYRVTFDANTYTGANVSYLELAYGQGLRPEGYDRVMNQLTIATPVTDTYTVNDIVPAATGVYYFGFHDISVPRYGALLLHQFTVTKVKDAPAIKGDVDGNGRVDIDDMNILVNIILQLATADEYDGRADVDSSGRVDIDDVNQVINIILAQ